MKSFKKALPFLALLFAIVSSFAFRPMEKKFTGQILCTYYTFIGNAGQEHDPTKYVIMNPQPTSWPVCPAPKVVLCAICVRSTEIYTSGPKNGLPKVDDTTTSIYTQIDNGINSGPSDIFVVVSGDLVEAVEFKP